METDTLVVDQEKPKKQPSRNAAAKKATYAVLSDDEDDEPEHHRLMPTIDEHDDDDDFSIIEEVPKSVKGKGRKPRNETAAATRKRGSTQASKANSQKPNTNVQPAARVSPKKKVRKMRASPFNKKSESVSSRLPSSPSASEDSGGSLPNIAAAIDEVAAVTERTRPKRDNRSKAVVYVESDSEEEEDEVEDDATEDSDFQEEDED